VLAWRRFTHDDSRLVLINFTDAATDVPAIEGIVEVASDGAGEGESFTGRLASNQALILRAAS
jgi:alpha-glucosidase